MLCRQAVFIKSMRTKILPGSPFDFTVVDTYISKQYCIFERFIKFMCQIWSEIVYTLFSV